MHMPPGKYRYVILSRRTVDGRILRVRLELRTAEDDGDPGPILQPGDTVLAPVRDL